MVGVDFHDLAGEVGKWALLDPNRLVQFVLEFRLRTLWCFFADLLDVQERLNVFALQ